MLSKIACYTYSVTKTKKFLGKIKAKRKDDSYEESLKACLVSLSEILKASHNLRIFDFAYLCSDKCKSLKCTATLLHVG